MVVYVQGHAVADYQLLMVVRSITWLHAARSTWCAPHRHLSRKGKQAVGSHRPRNTLQR
jgi:hypothetical protein